MAYVLFDQGVKVGEISDWALVERPAEKKTVLGKEIVTREKSGHACSFTSPKPLKRKSVLTVIADGKIKFVLQQTKITGGTEVAANIVSQEKL